MINDDEYCTLCGAVSGDCCPDDIGLHECLTSPDRHETLCDDCCVWASLEYQSYMIDFGDSERPDHLDYFEWFKLAYNDRIILVDNVTYMELHQAASSLGLTVDQFVVQAVTAMAEQILEGESE